MVVTCTSLELRHENPAQRAAPRAQRGRLDISPVPLPSPSSGPGLGPGLRRDGWCGAAWQLVPGRQQLLRVVLGAVRRLASAAAVAGGERRVVVGGHAPQLITREQDT